MLFGLGAISHFVPRIEVTSANPEAELQEPQNLPLALPAPITPTQIVPLSPPPSLEESFQGMVSRSVEFAVYSTMCKLYGINPNEGSGYAGIIAHGSFHVEFIRFLNTSLNKANFMLAVPLLCIMEKLFSLTLNSVFKQIFVYVQSEMGKLVDEDPQSRIHLLNFVSQKIQSFIQLDHANQRGDDTIHHLRRSETGMAQDDGSDIEVFSLTIYKELAEILIDAFHPKLDFGIESSIRQAIESLNLKKRSLSESDCLKVAKSLIITALIGILNFFIKTITSPIGRLENFCMKSLCLRYTDCAAEAIRTSMECFSESLNYNHNFQLDIQRQLNSIFDESDPLPPPRPAEITTISEQERSILLNMKGNIFGLFGNSINYALMIPKVRDTLDNTIVEKYRTNLTASNLNNMLNISLQKMRESIESQGEERPRMLTPEELSRDLQVLEEQFDHRVQAMLSGFIKPPESTLLRLPGKLLLGTTNLVAWATTGHTISSRASYSVTTKVQRLRNVLLGSGDSINIVTKSSLKSFSSHLRQRA